MIIGPEISGKEAKLLGQYVQALERQIAAEKKEAFQFQKLISQLNQDNSRLTDSYYAIKKEKENYKGQVKWLEGELQFLQRDIGFLLTEKARLQQLLAQAQSQLRQGNRPSAKGNDQAPGISQCSGSCKTAFVEELSELKKVAGEREEMLRQLQEQRDKALEQGEGLKRQRSALLQSYKCTSLLQLTKRLSNLESGEQQLQLLKNSHAMREPELAQITEKLAIILQQSQQMRLVSADLERRNQSLQMELGLNSQRLQLLRTQLTLTSEELAKKDREIAQLQLQNARTASRIEMGNNLVKESLESELLSLGSAYDELKSKYEKSEEKCRISFLQCQALERSIKQIKAESQVLLAEKGEEIKKLIDLHELLQQRLCQNTEQIKDYEAKISRLETWKINYEKTAEGTESLKERILIIHKQNEDKSKSMSILKEQIQKKSSEIENLNRKNDSLRNSLSELQGQTIPNKLQLETLRRRVLLSESHNESPQIQALSQGVVILKGAVDEQRRIIKSLSDAVRQREGDIAILESSNSELRRQIVSAINNQELAMRELTRERERSELRTRKRQKPYYFSRVTCYDNELDSFCRQSEKPSSTSRNMIDFAAQCPSQPGWSISEGNQNFRRSIVEEIIHLNESCDTDEAGREVVKVSS